MHNHFVLLNTNINSFASTLLSLFKNIENIKIHVSC